jgi:hypothetical protein
MAITMEGERGEGKRKAARAAGGARHHLTQCPIRDHRMFVMNGTGRSLT